MKAIIRLKHLGPGPHPSGTPQTIHSPRGGSRGELTKRINALQGDIEGDRDFLFRTSPGNKVGRSEAMNRIAATQSQIQQTAKARKGTRLPAYSAKVVAKVGKDEHGVTWSDPTTYHQKVDKYHPTETFITIQRGHLNTQKRNSISFEARVESTNGRTPSSVTVSVHRHNDVYAPRFNDFSVSSNSVKDAMKSIMGRPEAKIW